jgi:hypothetical protein
MKNPHQLELPLESIYTLDWKLQDQRSQERLTRSKVANYCWDVVHGHKTLDYRYRPKDHELQLYYDYLVESQEYYREEFLSILNKLKTIPRD